MADYRHTYSLTVIFSKFNNDDDDDDDICDDEKTKTFSFQNVLILHEYKC